MPLDAQAQRDKCKKPDKRKSNKKVLQIQLPDKAQPQSAQPEFKLEQQQQQQQQKQKQQREQQQIDALISQNLAHDSQKTQLREAHCTHSVDTIAAHTSSSDTSTASCDSDSEEAVSEKLSSMCHHCLRPQIELQLRHLRPQQRRQWSRLLKRQRSKPRNSKSRKEVSWSGGNDGNGRGRRDGGGDDDGGAASAIDAGFNRYGASDHGLPPNTYATGVGAHWSRRDVSAAVRYRCPQVGPKPAPYHFHHPQQLHNAYQLQLLLQQCEYVPPSYYQQQQQLQQYQQPYSRRQMIAQNSMNVDYYNTPITTTTTTTATAATATTINIECESQTNSRKQQVRHLSMQLNQNFYATTSTTATTTTTKTATSSGCSENCYTSNTSLVGATTVVTANRHIVATQPQLQPQPTPLSMQRATRGTVSDSELQLQQQQTTAESPSLVKVRAWYTVAKQGVSC